MVWSGWQGGVAQTGNGATGSVGVSFPVATNKDGTPITGLSREEYIQDYAGGTPNVIPLTYAPASLTDKSEVTFTARQSWLNAAGKQDYAAPSVPVTTWSYVTNANGSVSVQFTPPAAGADAERRERAAGRRDHLQLRLSGEGSGRDGHRLRRRARPGFLTSEPGPPTRRAPRIRSTT